MTLLTLHCHPATPCTAVHSLQVTLERGVDGSLHLQYILRGDLAHIRIPALQAPAATDGLWQHTCFEAFIGVQGNSLYHEFNFSPSRQWAAYAFSGYRERLAWTGHVSSLPDCQAIIPTAAFPPNPQEKPLQLALTAVIETITGEKSYWSLYHPTEHPDFHHRDGFTHEIWP
jgi:hypothetical protein